MSYSPGARLGRYEVLAPLSAGGMGEIYRAKDVTLGRSVALKLLASRTAPSHEAMLRFRREAETASSLNHPAIVTIYEIGQADPPDSQLFIAMELIDGENFRAWLSRKPPVERILELLGQCADGLARAHANGIVHRDLKPENVMVSNDGFAKVVDFGLAKLVETTPYGQSDPDAPTVANPTASGVVMGTVGYMAPEQVRGEALDARADVFAFGCILHEALAGVAPFRGGSQFDTLHRILTEPAPPLPRPVVRRAPSLQTIVDRCLAKDRNDRFESMSMIAAELRSIRNLLESRQAKPTRKPLVAGIAAVALVAVAISSYFVRGHLKLGPPAVSAAQTDRSLAVLPFDTFGARSDEYIADGITESLITDLAKLPKFLVIARNSVFRYKGKPVDIRSVGKDLGVRYVLEGSVQRSGDRIRINAQLIDAATNAHVWADHYDRPAGDLFTMQDELSTHIGEVLQQRFGENVPRGAALRPANPAAYDAYLKASYFASNDDWSVQDRSIPLFEKSIELDPTFAPAHGHLAQQYARKSFQNDRDRAWQEKAFVEIEKALALDPTLSMAYVARGNLSFNVENGFQNEKAVGEFLHAVKFDPNSSAAHDSLGSVLFHVGLLDEALAEFNTALRIDPYDDFAKFRVARIHWYQGHYDQANSEFRKIKNHTEYAVCLDRVGRRDEALAMAREGAARGDSDFAAAYALLLARRGDAEGAKREIERSIAKGGTSSHFHHAAYFIACAWVAMNENGKAVNMLQQVARDGLPCYPLFATDPLLDPIRKDPRFIAFLAQSKSDWEHMAASYRQQRTEILNSQAR